MSDKIRTQRNEAIKFVQWCEQGKFVKGEYMSPTQIANIIMDKARECLNKLRKMK